MRRFLQYDCYFNIQLIAFYANSFPLKLYSAIIIKNNIVAKYQATTKQIIVQKVNV